MGHVHRYGTFAALLAVIAFALPIAAHADVSVKTTQLLPPGGNSCPVLTVPSTQSYIYDGHLDSFDVTVSNPSFIAIDASVGHQHVSLRSMTRSATAAGARTHVDVASTPIRGTVPITMTFLSSMPGQPTCISIVSFMETGPIVPAPTSGSVSNPQTPAPAKPQPTTSSKPTPTQVETKPTTSPFATKPATTSNVSAAGTFVTAAPVLKGALNKAFESSCSADGAFQVWFVLLALYVAIVAYIILGEPMYLMRDQKLTAGAIIVPLVVLVCFWYFIVNCRAADWIPLVILAIGMIGLLIAFREAETAVSSGVIRLPAAKDTKKPEKKGK